MIGFISGCSNEPLTSTESVLDKSTVALLDVAQTSGQLASGTSFRISGSSTDSTGSGKPDKGHHSMPPHHGIMDGVSMLAPTEELLTIIDAESASDFRGLRISKDGGATITNYSASGAIVTLPIPAGDGPNGCSFSGKQFPQYDSILSKIAKTVIDFGSGVTYKRDTITIVRSGKIIITRTGTNANKTEVTTFDNYAVNGNKIEGTKTRVNTFDSATGSGTSTTSVSNGKITFSSGKVAAWISDKKRTSSIVLNSSTGKPVSGKITTEVNASVTASNGTIIYSDKSTSPLIENIACQGRRRGPVSGTLETIYGSDTISVDFGNGTCENKTISITLNGVTTTKTIGE